MCQLVWCGRVCVPSLCVTHRGHLITEPTVFLAAAFYIWGVRLGLVTLAMHRTTSHSSGTGEWRPHTALHDCRVGAGGSANACMFHNESMTEPDGTRGPQCLPGV